MAFLNAVIIESQISGPIRVDPKAEATGLTRFFMEILKPKITAETSVGPVFLAPYGEPRTDYRPFIGAVIILIFMLGLKRFL